MMETPRELVEALGGYRSVASRLGKKPTTVHTQMQSGAFPAAWYDAMCKLSNEACLPEPNRSLFSFVVLKGEAA